MAQKEFLTISIGAIISIIIITILNIILNINIVISIIISLLIGLIIGLIIGKLTPRTALGIIAWGLIGFAVLSFILKLTGIINSPPITEILLGGILAELLRIETKFKEFHVRLSMSWSDFVKRKKI